MTGKKALIKVAKQNGVSVAEVKREIEIAIKATFENPNPVAQATLKEIPMKGLLPTPEEFIEYMSKKVKLETATKCCS